MKSVPLPRTRRNGTIGSTLSRPDLVPLAAWLAVENYSPRATAEILDHATVFGELSGLYDAGWFDTWPDYLALTEMFEESQPEVPFDDPSWDDDDRWVAGDVDEGRGDRTADTTLTEEEESWKEQLAPFSRNVDPLAPSLLFRMRRLLESYDRERRIS